jgi:hypothetical protein
MTEKRVAAAAFAVANDSTYGAAWPTFIAPMRTLKKTCDEIILLSGIRHNCFKKDKNINNPRKNV